MKKRISSDDITLFSRQMATMLAAGIPIVQSLAVVSGGLSNVSMQTLIASIKMDVASGTSLAKALQRYPIYFNSLFCHLVDAGEQSGTLDIMLANLASYKEKTESLKGKIKKALFYPTAVLIIAMLVTAALLIFVVPQFESLFQGFGSDLPAMTKLLIRLSALLQSNWWIILAVLSGAIYTINLAKKRSKKFSTAITKIMLRIPIIGTVLEKAAIARFARTLAITFAAGLPLVDALKSVAGATGNLLFADATHRIREAIASGQQMQQAMRSTKIFPNMVMQMVAIGEESGALAYMLAKIADIYEEQVDNTVDSLSNLLEPLIMALLGIIVGGLVIAMYLPIFKLGSAV